MNKYYNTTDVGGWNPCIKGNSSIIARDSSRNVLPNCVGYTVARFNEIANANSCKYLGNSNANWFMNWAKQQNLKTGNTPKVGAAIIWDDGNCGHCAIVEQVISPNEIIISESGWSAKSYVWNARHYSSNNWCDGDDKSWMGTKYKFLGFIYNPIYEITEPVEENKNVDQLYVACDDTMYCRITPNGNKIGLTKKGFYNALETKEDGDYVWVKIAENNWVAILEPYSSYKYKYVEPEPVVEPEPIEPEKEPEKEVIIDEDKLSRNPLVWLISIIVKFFINLFGKGDK